MNKTEIKNLAIEIMVDVATQEGEYLYFIDHDEVIECITANKEMTEEEVVELSKLVREFDLEKLNEELLSEIEDEFIFINDCICEYS